MYINYLKFRFSTQARLFEGTDSDKNMVAYFQVWIEVPTCVVCGRNVLYEREPTFVRQSHIFGVLYT